MGCKSALNHVANFCTALYGLPCCQNWYLFIYQLKAKFLFLSSIFQTNKSLRYGMSPTSHCFMQSQCQKFSFSVLGGHLSASCNLWVHIISTPYSTFKSIMHELETITRTPVQYDESTAKYLHINKTFEKLIMWNY